MIVAAVIDGWKLKVPNWLTFPLVLSGWTLGLLHSFGLFAGATGAGDVWASLAGDRARFRPALSRLRGRRHGRRRRQDADGLWRLDRRLLRFLDLVSGSSSCAFCLAVVIGGVLALAMIVVRGNSARTWPIPAPSLAICSPSRTAAAEKAAQRKSRMHLLPYGIPLCLGFLSFLIVHPW